MSPITTSKMQTQTQTQNQNTRNSSNNRSDGPRGNYRGRGYRGNYQQNQQRAPYASWKAPEPPKEKVLLPSDFPPLPMSAGQPKMEWVKPDTSLAERVKEQIEKQEAAKLRGQVEEEVNEKLDVVIISSWFRSKYLAKKREEDYLKRAAAAEEENYRWQISPEMIPEPKEAFMEPSMMRREEEDQEEMECVDE